MTSYSILLMKATSSPEDDEPDTSPNEYERLLSQFGCKVSFIPPLQFEFVNIDILKDKFRQPDKFSGVVLTSPRSVDACQKAFDGIRDKSNLDTWLKSKYCYTVGPSTAQKAIDLLSWSPNQIRGGHECGNSLSLSLCIKEDFTGNVNFTHKELLLYPCGNLKRETLAHEVGKSKNVELDIVTCYKTVANHQLEELIRLVSEDKENIDIIVFFSPSGVKFCWDLLQKYIRSDPKYIAIGPTTMTSLKTYCKEESLLYESETPSAHGVQSAVRHIMNKT